MTDKRDFWFDLEEDLPVYELSTWDMPGRSNKKRTISPSKHPVKVLVLPYAPL